MINRYLAVLALAAATLGSAAAQTAIGSQSAIGRSMPSAPSGPGSTFISRSGDAAADAAAGRPSSAAPAAATPSGIDPAFQGMGARADSAVLAVPPTGPMYLNGRLDDVRKTCPPGTVRRDYRCAPATDLTLGR